MKYEFKKPSSHNQWSTNEVLKQVEKLNGRVDITQKIRNHSSDDDSLESSVPEGKTLISKEFGNNIHIFPFSKNNIIKGVIWNSSYRPRKARMHYLEGTVNFHIGNQGYVIHVK